MQLSPFVADKYVADRDIEKHYHDQASYFLAKHYNKDISELEPLVKEIFVPNKNGFKEANFEVIEKNKYGDREMKVKTAREFFNQVEENNYHLSPSFVAYKHSDEEQSVNSIGTEKFLTLRSVNKGYRQDAKAAGDDEMYKAFHEIQNALKIFNNAQSGAMSSNGTPLNNKSGHTSLTSTCRALTSTANILNERLLTGNRLFINYEKTLENFLSLLRTTDLVRMEKVIKSLKMNYATTDQIMTMVSHCTNYYWDNDKRMGYIRDFVELLNPVEKTTILCVLDINGLYTTNPELMKEYFDDWCAIPKPPEGAKEEDYKKPSNGDYYTLCISKLLKASKVEINFLHEYHLSVEEKWKDFIEIFFKGKVPPSGVFSIKEMIRESVLTSDTDSSIYTVDKTVDKYTDDTDVALRLNGVLTYFVRMVAVHQHAQLSKNMNVSDKNQGRLTMKNEFAFGSYVTTLMSKHYFATQLMVEGIMNKEVEMEIKGVHLRSSKVAQQIKDFAHKLMRDILDASFYKEQLDASELLASVANLERLILQDIKEGNWSWLSRATIKSKEVYAKPDSSIYFYNELWENVFADKYGNPPEAPYSAIKLNAVMDSKLKLEEYLDGLGADNEIGKKMRKFLLEDKDKAALKTFYIPMDMIKAIGGVPEEMLPGVDFRSIIKQNLKSVYAVLETTGIYYLNKKISRLVSDEH